MKQKLTILSFLLLFIGASGQVKEEKTNTQPVIKKLYINDKMQGEQGVVQKVIGAIVQPDVDGHELTYTYRIVSGNATLKQVDKHAILYPKDKNKIVIELEVSNRHGASATKTISYTDLKIEPEKLYTDEATWMAAVGNTFKDHPSFKFQQRNDELPNVLIIGNSISIGYTPFVQEELQGKCNVYRIPENGGDTKHCLRKLDLWLGDNNWDVIHFNFGLHDLKKLKNNQLDIAGEVVNTKEEYAENLEKIVKRLKKQSSAKLIWASTSVVPEGAEGRIKGVEVEYNQIAEKIMIENEIDIDDQYTLTQNNPEDQMDANVHFHQSGMKRQAKQVALYILEHIK